MRVEGLQAVEQGLGELTKATGRKNLRIAALDALEPMRAVAEANANAADFKWSGATADSTEVSTKLRGYAKRTSSKDSTVEAYMGPGGEGGDRPPPEASLQEFGTSHHPPQPWMRPAYEQEKRPTIERVAARLTELVFASVARARRKKARAAARG